MLGTALAEELAKEHIVSGLDKSQCDLADKESLFKKANNPDVIIHAAAMTNVDLCQKEPSLCWRDNVEGTRNVAEAARKNNSKLIYISTASVFDGEKGGYKEEDIPNPQGFYNLTKLLGEEAALSYENSLILRINVIGIHPKRKEPANFAEWLKSSLKANKDINLFKDVRINPLTQETISKIVLKIISEWPKQRILHLGSKDIMSKAEIAMMIIDRHKDYKGKAKAVSISQSGLIAKRGKEITLDVSLAEKTLNIKMPNLKEEINKIKI